MKILKINCLWLILCCFVLLSCSISGPRYSGPTYEVDASTINGVVNHFEAQYDNKWFPGNFTPSIQPRVTLNDQFALFRWTMDPGNDNYQLVKVDIFKNMPPGFRKNTENMLLFNLFEDQRPHVGYKMWLSDITYKTIYHPETPQERAQRELDEKMWLALKNGEVEKVRYYVNKGANVEQPWMLNKQKHALWGLVGKTRNVSLLDFFIQNGKKYNFNLYSYAHTWQIPQAVKLAKKYKADVNDIMFFPDDEKEIKCPLILKFVILDENFYIKALLKDGANVDFNIDNNRQEDYWKPWHNKPFLTWAKHNTRPDIYRLLASYSKRARRH